MMYANDRRNIDICSIETGEVLHTFFDTVWFAESKKKVRKWIKDNGYTAVRADFAKYGWNDEITENGTVWVC